MKIGVIGAGTMGQGIAQIVAQNKHSVVLYDLSRDQLNKSRNFLLNIFTKLESKNKLSATDTVDSVMQRICFTNSLEDIKGSSFVIEAVVEDKKVKKDLFINLEGLLEKSAIVATNTSSLSVTELSSSFKYRERFLGAHFFNPPALMKLVELVPTPFNSDEYLDRAKNILVSWGKIVVKAKDWPGFIVNKIARPYYGEALAILEEGIATIEQIDIAMEKLGGFKMGPFKLMDLIGIDVNYKANQQVFQAYGFDPRYRPSLLQLKLVEAGKLGRKTSNGFYRYNQGEIVVFGDPILSSDKEEYIFMRILSMLINEASDTVFRQIASDKDVDLAVRYGVNYPKGLLEWGADIGYRKVVDKLDKLFQQRHDMRYRVSPYLRDLASKE